MPEPEPWSFGMYTDSWSKSKGTAGDLLIDNPGIPSFQA